MLGLRMKLVYKSFGAYSRPLLQLNPPPASMNGQLCTCQAMVWFLFHRSAGADSSGFPLVDKRACLLLIGPSLASLMSKMHWELGIGLP